MNQIRSVPNITGCAAAGFQDASIWEEAKSKGAKAVHALIDKGLENTSVTVVCVGSATAGRTYINYEIDKSIARGNGIVAVRVHHLVGHDGKVNLPGAIPPQIGKHGYKTYIYTDHKTLRIWIEAAAKAAGK